MEPVDVAACLDQDLVVDFESIGLDADVVDVVRLVKYYDGVF